MDERFKCLICEKELVCEWTDFHGEGVCLMCGAPYQLIQRDESGKILDVDPIIKINDEYIPWLRRYWEETGKDMGLGLYLGTHKYPDRRDAFEKWMDENCDIAQPEDAPA